MQFISHSPDEMTPIAAEILRQFPDISIFILEGTLGSGKTAFTKGFCKTAGVEEDVSSPTFSIVHEYSGSRHDVFHFDLYRLKNRNELFQIGFEEYLERPGYKLIEWPEVAESLMNEDYVRINFRVLDENTRELNCERLNISS